MKRPPTRTWVLLASVLMAGWVLLLAWSLRSRPAAKQWLALSRPVFGSRTNAGVVTPVVRFCVSNVGPRPVDCQVWWFECRARGDRSLLATNQLEFVRIPLSRGGSTNLTIEVRATAALNEGRLCCYQVIYFERVSGLPRVLAGLDRFMSWYFDIFELTWRPRWTPLNLRNGCAFASNVSVADYFRLMHGFTRSQWLEELARMQSARTRATSGVEIRYAWAPTAEERYANEAWLAFAEYCRTSTNASRVAETDTPPNAAPAQK